MQRKKVARTHLVKLAHYPIPSFLALGRRGQMPSDYKFPKDTVEGRASHDPDHWMLPNLFAMNDLFFVSNQTGGIVDVSLGLA